MRLLAAATLWESFCRRLHAPSTEGSFTLTSQGNRAHCYGYLLFTQHLISSSKSEIWVGFSRSKENSLSTFFPPNPTPPTRFLSHPSFFPVHQPDHLQPFFSQALSHQSHWEVTRLENSYVFLRNIKAPHLLSHLEKKLFEPQLLVWEHQAPASLGRGAWRRKLGPSLHCLVMHTWCHNSPAVLQEIRPGLLLGHSKDWKSFSPKSPFFRPRDLKTLGVGGLLLKSPQKMAKKSKLVVNSFTLRIYRASYLKNRL